MDEADKMKCMTLILRQTGQEAAQSKEPLQWPPTAWYLEHLESVIPNEQGKFPFFSMTEVLSNGLYQSDYLDAEEIWVFLS